MGSDAHVVLVDPAPGAMTAAVEQLHHLDRCWSRFRPDSELSMLNTAQGAWVAVSFPTMVLVTTMQVAGAETDAWFDPTFLFEVLQTGYRHSTDDPQRLSVVVDRPCPGMSIDDAEIDTDRSRLRLPDGMAIDAGGIGKGLAADLTVEMLLTGGTTGALVSIGGDMTAAGRAPEPSGWSIDVEHPLEPGTIHTRLTVSGGGTATSSTRKRRSTANGVSRHHTIDPRTRQSAATDLAAVTVIAPTGWQAEAHATALLLNGRALAGAYAAEHSLTGLAMGDDGSELRFGSLESAQTLPAEVAP